MGDPSFKRVSREEETMARKVINCDVRTRRQVYQTWDRLDALWSIDHALREIQRRDCSGVDPELLEEIVEALESAERVLLAIE
jgi:hypothetical protein